MYQRKNFSGNLLKGILIGVLCLVLIVGVVLCVRGPKAPGSEPQDAQLSAAPTEPSEADAPQQETEPTKPASVPQETTPAQTEPQNAPTQPKPAVPEATRPQPGQSNPTEPQPTAPAPTQPQPTEPAPTEPAPTEPTPTEPAPTEPEPTEPEKEIFQVLGQVSAENNVVTQDASFGQDGISAQVPSGTVLDSGTTELVLTIEKKENSDSGITTEAGQSLQPLDVHIAGVSPENTAPITICLGKILPNGMNIGNVGLYHVENGSANPMAQVLTAAELDSHNEFYYDPATGDITVAMASFSEIAVVSDTEKPWEGNIAETFADGSGTEEDPYIIANADQLAYMSQVVSNDEAYASAYYKLIADINLNGEVAQANDRKDLVFYPIGYWKQQDGTNSAGEIWYSAGNTFTGTFDGNGNTISNIYQNTWLMDGNYDNGYWNTAMGLFGALYNATIKNLTVDNFQSDGEFTPTGCIAAYAGGPEMLFENIHLTNCNPRVYNTGNGGLVGLNYNSSSIGAYDHITFRNITVDQTNKISALWGSYDVSCGGILGRLRENAKHDGTNTEGQKNTVTFENCHVAAIMDVNNDCCANYQYYQYRYSGMLIGTVDYVGDVPAVGVADVVAATGCTVTYGDWNEYWYCELVKNSLASYTHDHQFSRLVEISSIDEIKSNETWLKEGNFVLPNENNTAAECYHIFKNSEGNLYRHFHNVADESNPNIYETTDLNGDGELNDLKEDRQCYFIPFAQLWTGYGWGSSPTYAFEGITVANGGTVKSEPKFESKTIDLLAENDTVKLSDLVTLSVDESKLSKSTLAVFVSPVGDESTVSADIRINTSAWGDSILTFSGTGAAKIVITDYFYCTPTEIYVTVGARESAEKFDKLFTGDFLYRVGNNSSTPVALSSLFAASSDATISDAKVVITCETISGNATMTHSANTSDWDAGTVAFTGTGVVKLTITDNDYCIPTELYLEVVDAYNVTSYNTGNYKLQNRNSVLLCDIEMSSGSNFWLSNTTLYGNGFTFDCRNAAYTGTGSVSENYIVGLNNSHLDNVEIIGAVYTSYGAQASNDNNRALIVSKGTSTITNCYLSNTASPVRLVEGLLTIQGSTLKGGNFANIDVRNGHLTVEDVTTINQSLGNDTAENGNSVIGLGIVVYYENVDTSLTSITINGTLTQYNHISNNDEFSSDYAQQLVDEMLGSKHTDLQLKDNGVTWVNTGIVSMSENMENNIKDNRDNKNGYTGKTVTFISVDGYVYTVIPSATSISAAPVYVTAGQGTIAPSYTFNNDVNDIPKADDRNDYCYQENGKILIAVDQGNTFEWDPFILSATKNGTTLHYTVSMNGTTYTSGEKIPFNTSGEYTVKYTYVDNDNYTLTDGNITTVPVTYEKTLPVSVSVIQPSAQHATFTFADTNTATEKINIGNATYISATGVNKTDKEWGYITVNGTNIYYPITEAQMKKNTLGTEVQVYYYVFNDAVTITDYADAGTGAAVPYDASTTTMPSNLTVVNGMEAKYTSIDSACVNISALTKDGPSGEVWDFSASTTISGTTTYSGYLAHSSPSGLAIKSGTRDYDAITVAQFCYTDNAGATYYYFVGYFMPNQVSSSSGGSCITGDTLITLADGSQVRVDALTGDEELLVWNLETGSYDTAPIVFIDSEAEAEYEVVNLCFSDGSEVGVIYEHGFFDYDLGKYVYLDAGNAESYIGHTFVTQGDIAGNTWNTATLTDVVIETKVTTAYSPVTFSHLCYYTDGVLSMPGGIEGLFNIFQVDTSIMAYDADKKAQDIEAYGLYTYEDFADVIPEDAFYAFNGAYLKVAIGKGMLTWEDIEYLAQRYVPLM